MLRTLSFKLSWMPGNPDGNGRSKSEENGTVTKRDLLGELMEGMAQ